MTQPDLPPEIPPIPEEIIEAAKSGKLVLFIGAGVSRRAGGPSWDELANGFLDQLAGQPNSRITFGDLAQLRDELPKIKISIASNVWKTDGVTAPDFRAIIQPNFNTAKIPKVYRDLYGINACYVTTNYDEWLDILANDRLSTSHKTPTAIPPEKEQTDPIVKQNEYQMVFYEKDDLTREKLLKQGAVIHLHGSVVKPETMVLTTRDYFDHYQHACVEGFMNKLFSREFTVVFIGYRAQEDEILEFVLRKRTSDRKLKQERKFFRLYPLFPHQMGIYQHMANYFQTQCDVYPVPYSADRNGEQQLDLVIENWSRILIEHMRPPSPFEKLKILDEAING